MDRLFWVGIVSVCALICEPVWGVGPPEGEPGLILDVQGPWAPGDGALPSTERWHVERPGTSLRFVVDQPGRGATLNYGIPLRLDPERTPILAVTYRADGIRIREPDAAVFAVFGRHGDLPVVRHRDLVADGEVHTARIDLAARVQEADADTSVLEWIDLRVHAADDRPGSFELIALRFEFAPGFRKPADQAADASGAGAVRVCVVDEAGRPVEGAAVVLDAHLRNLAVHAATDADGRAVVKSERPDLADTRRSLRIRKDDCVEVLFTDLHGVDAETELKAVLAHAETVGGRVVDEAGEPVPDAVGILLMSGGPEQDIRGRPARDSGRRVRADHDGRWNSPPLPRSESLDVQVRWMQPGYLQDRWGGQYSGSLTMDALREHNALSVLRRGIVLTGRVSDRDGKPIAHAMVAQGEDRFCSNVPPDTQTDAHGRYRFDNIPEGKLVLTVTADGHAPRIAQAEARPGMDPIDFVLDPPAIFRFRVVDTDGNPLKGAYICPDTWLGFRSIPGRFLTDANGELTWKGPPDPVEFDIFIADKLDHRGAVYAPSRDETDVHEVVLQEPLRIVIKAVDARTGNPLEQFEVVSGILSQSAGEAPYWERRAPLQTSGRDGTWEHTFTYDYPFRVFRVEADGHAPAVTEPVASTTTGRVELSVQLEPAESLACTLKEPSGKPVAGETVYLAAGQSMPVIRDGRIEYSAGTESARTDQDGRFIFPPQGAERFLLVVCGEAGYLEMEGEDLAASGGTITLRPWTTVTGTLLVGDRPGSGETVAILRHNDHDSTRPLPHHRIQVEADKEGRFSFDRVPPGQVSVAHVIPLSENSWGYSQAHRLEATPGERIDVHIGGAGRPIVGRTVWPNGTDPGGLTSTHCSLSTKIDADALRERQLALLPDGAEDWDLQERAAFMQTEAGQAIREQLSRISNEIYGKRRTYSFAIDADGGFRINDVTPGEYVLQISVRTSTGTLGMGDEVARHQTDVSVPALPEDVVYVAQPIDLGALTLQSAKRPIQVGQAAPDFAVRVLDPDAEDQDTDEEAARFTLSKHRGKVVLVDFWATWCGPCVAETPNLKAVWDVFGSHPRFTMIGLSLDQNPDAPTKYARKNDTRWIQGFLGAGDASPVPGDYGVQGIPTILLIGPDGTVLDTGLRGAGIHAAVASALGAL